MPNPLAEAVRLVRQFRWGVPWDSSRVAYCLAPAAAVLLSWGLGVGAVGSLWCVSPVFRFKPWTLAILIVPAAGGFYLTYLFDLLQIGLGWRTLEALFQFALGVGVFSSASGSLYGVMAGLVGTVAAWVTGIRMGSDLVPFRPDRLAPGHCSDLHVGQDSLRNLLKNMLSWLLLASLMVGFAMRWQRGGPVGLLAPLAAGVGAATYVSAAITLLGWTRHVVQRYLWEAEGAVILGSLDRCWVRRSWQLAAGAGFVGWLFPADVSPLARLPYESLFSSLSALVAPSFVRNGPGQRRAQSQFGAKLAAVLVGDDPGGASLNAVIQLSTALFMVLLVGAVFWVMWRFLPLMRVGDQVRPMDYARDKGFWRWLWSSLLGFFRRATGRLFEENPLGKRQLPWVADAPRARKQRRPPSEPYTLVRYLFGLFLQSAADRGWPRCVTETAGEYTVRLAHDLPPDEAKSVRELTSLYELIRYGGKEEQADDSVVLSFRRCLAAAFRALRQRARQ